MGEQFIGFQRIQLLSKLLLIVIHVLPEVHEFIMLEGRREERGFTDALIAHVHL